MTPAERGLLVGGFVLPGTQSVIRHPDAWFAPGSRGTRRRSAVVDLMTWHWNGGEAGFTDPDGAGPLTPIDDDGPWVFRTLRGRVGKTGAPLNAGYHLIVGGCLVDDIAAPVFQLADPGLTGVVSVGVGEVNARGIAIAVVSPGYAKNIDSRRPRPAVLRTVRGDRVACAGLLPGQWNSLLWLANRLTEPSDDVLRNAGIHIPRAVPTTTGGRLLSEVRHFTMPEIRRYAGALEHLLVPKTTKQDAGGMILNVLRGDGWASTPLGV